MPNPRIDDLRRKLEKEPGSRLFAQLAEELRKDGELAEAIRVCRQGLGQHPNYPSARMTLGRALLDSGDLGAARREFETVLNAAPDNILASRYLAECLEGLGETETALHRYRSTLKLAPGDKHVQARIEELEKAALAPPPSAAPEPAPPAAAASPEPEPEPIKLAEVEGPMELMGRFDTPPAPLTGAPATPAPAEEIFFDEPEAAPAPGPEKDEAAVPLVPVDEEEFELERAYEAVPVSVPSEPHLPAARPAPEPEPLIEPEPEPLLGEPPLAQPEPVLLEPDVIDEEFEVEPPPVAGPPRVTFREELLVAAEPASEQAVEASASASAAAAGASAAEPPPPSTEPELASPTLAELYFEQGVPEKAAEVYRRLLRRDPGNERLQARLVEVEAAARAASGQAAPATQREALGRAIARLEELRSVLSRRE